ncbi:MAG: hypothetical protein LBT50_04565 [Prevotellaceae bacterium]|nr:hypothetical protein [Prevotellaceae bacterium]
MGKIIAGHDELLEKLFFSKNIRIYYFYYLCPVIFTQMKYEEIKEESIKLKVSRDFFDKFDCAEIIDNIDFAVKLNHPKNAVDFNDEYLLWAETKQKPTDIFKMLTQLVLTIGKAREFGKILPPPFLGCFDNEKIAFVPYHAIQDIFYQNDFNWKVAPSDTKSKEFKQVYNQIRKILDNDIPKEMYQFNFGKDEKKLQQFISQNFIVGKTNTTKIQIDKNNFVIIYNKWLKTVKPTIQVNNWTSAKKKGIIDGDFYLADLLSDENKTLTDKLFVLLKTDHYELDRALVESGFNIFKTTAFSDNQKTHNQFWSKYERPQKKEFWDDIIKRRDLLAPQDIRERKGSFFTPQIWVELSQKYIADVLGINWQDEYYVWDCAAGTGNLLAGLTNKYNVWASTLDKADVEMMYTRIDTMNENSITGQGANLLKDHVFQFDFLNDNFDKLPKGLRNIISDPEKREKLVIYINPPYAEAGDSKQRTGTGKNKEGTTIANAIYNKYSRTIGKASNELFAQFLTRIYCEISTCRIANFSTLKNLQSDNFQDFRKLFQAKLEKIFLVPANTFDNVKGKFPIGFFIWNTGKKEIFEEIMADVYLEKNKQATYDGQKTISCYDNSIGFISKWLSECNDKKNLSIGILKAGNNDFQNQNQVYLQNKPTTSHYLATNITKDNLIESCIYFAVRKCIKATWLNDRDQFLYPNDGWETDLEFQNDCLAYTLFSNNIQSQYGTNHWIPFTEFQLAARDKFDSNFMIDFIAGEAISVVCEPTLFYGNSGGGYRKTKREPVARNFSPEAKSVFRAGQVLWRYYHQQPNCNVNASLYDIREHFQGRNEKGKMNNKSENEAYTNLIGDLRKKLILLAKKIEPKVYEYGFLK